MKTGKKVAILQSNYIPWKGYFDIMNMVDEFILYDDVQYTKNDWRNRNRIITREGPRWLSIPVVSAGKFYQKIKETKVADHKWADRHWRSIECSYARANFFSMYAERIKKIYEACRMEDYLSRINYAFLQEICDILGIQTKITWSFDYQLAEGKTKRLVSLVKDAGGSSYLSGPAAKDYIQEELFEEAGIELVWMDYSGYPQYEQSFGYFEHGVSVLDLIFHKGPEARKFMKSFGE